MQSHHSSHLGEPAQLASNAAPLVGNAIVRSGSLLILCATLMFASMSSDAGYIYRWADSDGTVHYGEHPPKGAKATRLETQTGKRSKRSSRKSSSAERKASGTYNGEPTAPPGASTESVATAPPAPNKNPKICENARYNLTVLNERARIRQVDENGEERYLSDEEKEQQKEAAQGAIDLYCG